MRAKADFERVFRAGQVVDRPELRIIWCRGDGKAAVVAAKAIGSLAHRNRVRRRWREALRLMVDRLPGDVDMVVLVKPRGLAIQGQRAVELLGDALGLLPN